MKRYMKKRFVNILLWSMCFLGGFEISFALQECPLAQTGYECYCPSDTTLACYNVIIPSSWTAPSILGTQGVTQSLLQVSGGDNSANSSTNVTFREHFFKNIQIYFMGLLGIVSVSVFLYIGYMLFTAQGKEEEFKKAWTALIYAVIGLAVMPLAYIVVKIVTGFTF